MTHAEPIHTIVRNSKQAVHDAAIVHRARGIIARSLDILRESQPGTFLGVRRHAEFADGATSVAAPEPVSEAIPEGSGRPA
ncbi:hypothetical protein JQ633_28305 [Bradyrhizobium tropiciagri]|uniref:hypothetical protein n=1 Tax=Bradyrhizobium tropiciagri TaxID=312253 RepID=UPI001BAB59A5|nr:hypothetical protein [Bradyrhizobium tropiciagri]MBR0874288.1 hypothetical protein [Bradyrhizobium tropiciagri]